MDFAPEDKRVWQESEVMAEFEKVAKETGLLNGGPPEAFQPIPEKIAEQGAWEDEDAQEPPVGLGVARQAGLASYGARLMGAIENLAHDLAEAGRIKVAYRLERTFAALKDICRMGGE